MLALPGLGIVALKAQGDLAHGLSQPESSLQHRLHGPKASSALPLASQPAEQLLSKGDAGFRIVQGFNMSAARMVSLCPGQMQACVRRIEQHSFTK